MLLQALVACAGVTLRAVATSLDIPVTAGTVRAEGDLDFRGTLAVSKEVPVGFSQPTDALGFGCRGGFLRAALRDARLVAAVTS